MAEELNTHFSSVFTREDTSSLPVPDTKFNGTEGGGRLGQLVVTPEIIASKINNLKDKKSPGVDGLNYEMKGSILCKTMKERNLGVTIYMKVSEQCRIAASGGNQILGLIRRNITYTKKGLILPLYKAIVIPHLEYCIQAWRPYRRKDIDMLKKIRSRATKLNTGLTELSYEKKDASNVV